MSQPLWEGRRVPFTLVGGYLGSGKTTLINEMLRSTNDRIVVLVNDVGDINIDAAQIANRDGDTIELTNGCVCCSLVDGFAVVLEQVRSMPERPDRIIAELSGVAEPQRVVAWTSTAGFRHEATIVTVDADQIRARADNPRLRDLVLRQLAAADQLVLTKTDLVSAEELALTTAWLDDRSAAPILSGPDATHDHVVTTVALSEPMSRAQANAVLANLSPDVVRAKGFARCDETTVLSLQSVGSRRDIRAVSDPDIESGSLVVISLPVPPDIGP
jgi:G3E family GTPase